MTITFDGAMKLTFGKSALSSHYAVRVACVSCLSVGALLGVYRATGALWVSYAGIACTYAAIAFAFAAFLAQTVSQVIRITSAIVAKCKGREAPIFREEDYIYGKPVKKVFMTVKEKGANLLRTLNLCFNAHARSTVRAHRRAPRSAHTRPSGDGSGGSSGDSDSGEPPKPLYPLAFPTLFSFNHKKRNSFSYLKRFYPRCGCWAMRRHGRPFGRWSA